MSRLYAKAQRDALTADFNRRVARALGEAVGTQKVIVTPTGADALRLRGIPAIGPGVSGEILHTRPDREVGR